MDFSRQEQLDRANTELSRHLDLGRLITVAKRTHAAQVSHLEGVYAEVDKLTKGKSLVPTSDLLVEIVNSLISDAKGLIHRDTYLERLKTFVPAGDNPAYPDVLVALRILQQTLSRFESMVPVGRCQAYGHWRAAKDGSCSTPKLAEADELKFYDDSPAAEDDEAESNDEEEEDEEEEEEEGEEEEENDDEDDPSGESEDNGPETYQEHVWKTEVSAKLDGTDVSATWFRRSRDGDYYFNFPRLYASGIPRYVPPAEGITFLHEGA